MVKIDYEKCTGCGLCVADCVALNIKIEDKKAYTKKDCFLCGHCVAICPAGAVSIPEYDMEDVEEHVAESFEEYAVESCSGNAAGNLEKCAYSFLKDLLHNIKFRRSVRSYKEEKVGQQELEMLLQAGRYTATAKNNQDCHFVFVQNEIEQLKEMVWGYVEKQEQAGNNSIYTTCDKEKTDTLSADLYPYVAFNRRRKADPTDDFLFRNAPVVLFITSEWPLDAGLAAQNIENMAVALGMGALYNGYLARIADANEELKKWMGIEGRTIKACLLLGYPKRSYRRTAPRKPANVSWR